MKIQIDTENKTIKLLDSEKLSKLMEVLDKLFPEKEWKNFTLETNVVIEKWSDLIIIKEYPKFPLHPVYPIWCSTTTTGNNLMKVHNIEIK